MREQPLEGEFLELVRLDEGLTAQPVLWCFAMLELYSPKPSLHGSDS